MLMHILDTKPWIQHPIIIYLGRKEFTKTKFRAWKQVDNIILRTILREHISVKPDIYK